MPTQFISVAITALKRSAAKFRKDTRGNMQMMLAITAAPLFGAAGIAIDYNRTLDAMVQIQDLADRTALFGASLDGTEEEQTAAANLFLDKNEIPFSGVTYDAEVSHGVDSVAVAVTTEVEGTLFKAFFAGMGKQTDDANMAPGIVARAKYIREKDKLVCVLALDSDDAAAIHLQGNGGFKATNCGMHSDSNHVTQSLYMNGGALAEADFFDTVGGWSKSGASGYFSVEPEGSQPPFGNPFAGMAVACPASTTTNATAANGTSAASPTAFNGTTYNNITVGSNRAGRLTQQTVYVFGTVDIKGTLMAPATTIVLCGANAKIAMGAQGVLQITAPTAASGAPFAGFAVVAQNTVTQSSTLIGGPSTVVRGMWYTPKAGLEIGGNSEFNANSSYFPVVVNKFYVSGTGKVNIGIDYEANGYDAPSQLVKAGKLEVWLTKYKEE